MSAGAVITNVGRNISLRNIFSTTQISGIVNYILIGSGTATPAVTDTALNKVYAGSYVMVAGYPTYDTTNQKATSRYFINSTQINGSLITEVGEFFASGGMFSRDVFTPTITKTGSDEIAFVFTTQIS